jgi:His/Glu/Gln/Arg/opine family amino acid ABC transporter permease subunit
VLSAISIVLSLIVGTVIGVMRVAPLTPVRSFAEGYIEFFRNIPLLIILFFILDGLPKAGITLSFFTTAVVGLTVYTAAYVAEVDRAGLQALSRGQIEAARSLGLTWGQTMRLVLLPQALRTTIPPLGTLSIALIKNTSLASTIAVSEILYQAEFIEGRTFNPNIFLIAGLLYLLLTVPASGLVNVVERKLAIAR